MRVIEGKPETLALECVLNDDGRGFGQLFLHVAGRRFGDGEEEDVRAFFNRLLDWYPKPLGDRRDLPQVFAMPAPEFIELYETLADMSEEEEENFRHPVLQHSQIDATYIYRNVILRATHALENAFFAYVPNGQQERLILKDVEGMAEVILPRGELERLSSELWISALQSLSGLRPGTDILCIHIKPDRLGPQFNDDVVEQLRKLPLAAELADEVLTRRGEDYEPYINLDYKTQNPRELWDWLQEQMHVHHLFDGAIVLCTGPEGWHNYLQLHHYDPKQRIDEMEALV